jgi:transcriptional regulator with XRE-family HTH domain
MNVRKAVAELIRAERRARKLKRRTVARRCGAAPSWLRRLESGKHPVTLNDFLDLAREIGFDPVRAFNLLAQHHADKRRKDAKLASFQERAVKATGKYSRGNSQRTKREAGRRNTA